MGVLLFLFANQADPKIMNFKNRDISAFFKNVKSSNLRLDQDEKDQSFYLIGKKDKNQIIKPVKHVEQIHLKDETCDINFIPIFLRKKIFNIIENYSKGYCKLINEKWVDYNSKQSDFM